MHTFNFLRPTESLSTQSSVRSRPSDKGGGGGLVSKNVFTVLCSHIDQGKSLALEMTAINSYYTKNLFIVYTD